MMRKSKPWLTFVFVVTYGIIAHHAKAESAWIYGNVPSYQGQTISAYYYKHHLFEEPFLLQEQVIDDNGQLMLSFDIDQTEEIFLDLGTYHIYYLLSPNDSLQVELPLFKPKTKADKYNIFFKPSSFYMVPISGDKHLLNKRRKAFEFMADTLFDSAILSIKKGTSDSVLNYYMHLLRQEVNKESSPYLKAYKHYKRAPFYALAYPYNPNVLVDTFLSHATPAFSNPAFWETLNAALTHQWNPSQELSPINKIASFLTTGDYDSARRFLVDDLSIKSESLGDLLLFKGLYELWYSHSKSRSDILNTLNLLKNDNQYATLSFVAEDMIHHFTKVYPGYPAAYYELPNYKGKLVPLTMKRKFVVLNFCSPEIQKSVRDFLLLERIKQTFGRKVEIINIVVYQEQIAFENFAQKQEGKMLFVHWDNQQSLLNDYQIKGLPSYFIINPDGNFVSSPAPGPGNGLEEVLENLIRMN